MRRRAAPAQPGRPNGIQELPSCLFMQKGYGGDMSASFTQRREFLKQAGLMGSLGSAAMMAGLPESAMAFGGGAARIVEEAAVPVQTEEAPKYHIKFAVCGMSHDHIYGMIGAVQRGGGELVAAWGGEEDKLAAFRVARRQSFRRCGRRLMPHGNVVFCALLLSARALPPLPQCARRSAAERHGALRQSCHHRRRSQRSHRIPPASKTPTAA